MSVSDQGPEDLTAHTCDDSKVDCRVFVNGVRIPVGDVDLHIRKEGPVDVTRYVEGEFASPFNDEDYLAAFNTIDPESHSREDGFDTLRVDVKDYETDQFIPQFHGLVTGVGAADGPERIWQFRGQGPGMVLDKIPVSEGFASGIKEELVLSFVRQQLSEKLPFDVGGGPVGSPDSPAVAADRQRSDEFEVGAADSGGLINSQKSFQRNRDTLADVLNWYGKKTGKTTWFRPTTDATELIGVSNPTRATTSHDAHYLGGDLRVINNNALTELRPINTLVVTGKAKRSLGSIGPLEVNRPADQYYAAEARHQDLYERSGGVKLHSSIFTKTDAQTKEEVEWEARKTLKERIDESTSGSMTTMLRSPIQPFDVVTAKPTCRETEATDTRPLDYEVSRVHHQIRGSGHSVTTLNVGLHTKISEDIIIVESWQSDA